MTPKLFFKEIIEAIRSSYGRQAEVNFTDVLEGTYTSNGGGGGGDVEGPASATDNAIVRFDGTTGKLVQNSAVTIADTTGDISGVGQLNATTVDATNIEVTNIKAKDGTSAGSIADSTGVVTLASTVLTTTDINGGTIDGTAIGATTPSTVAATTLSASGASSFPNSAPSVIGGLGFRNRIINGDMRIDQRNEGTAVTHPGSSNVYSLDRWVANATGAPRFSMQRVADAPAGFINSVKLTTTTSGTPASGDFCYFGQYVEGQNMSDLAFGTSSASEVTLSFWIKSSLTGTFGGKLGNSANNRAYVFSFSISAANTWEKKTVTITGDTTGTWLSTNGRGFALFFDLGSGSTLKGTAGSWGSTNYVGVTGGVNLVATAAATMNITGVQLEVGNAATEFERRPFGQELALCQRYFKVWRSSSAFQFLANGSLSSSTQADIIMPLPVTMRSAPVVTTSGTFRVYTIGSINISAFGTLSGFVDNIYLAGTISGGTGGHACLFGDQGSNNAVINASAEL